MDRLGAPVVLTINAKGVLPAGHPLNPGSRLPQAPVLEKLKTSDVVLAIGTELGETDTLLFDSNLDLQGKIIRVDIEQQQLTRNVMPDIAICSDAGLAMSALADALEDHSPNNISDQVSALREAADSTVSAVYHVYGRLLHLIEETLPDVVIVGDQTQPIYGGNLLYEPNAPRSYFNSSTGYGTLGYALSAALGAKLAEVSKPVVSLIGDGGLQFTIGELATAVELELPIPIIIWNNSGYGEIRQYMVDRNIPAIGVDIYTPDFIAIARGFGCRAFRADNPDQLVEFLLEAVAVDRPTIIELIEDSVLNWQNEYQDCAMSYS